MSSKGDNVYLNKQYYSQLPGVHPPSPKDLAVWHFSQALHRLAERAINCNKGIMLLDVTNP